MIHRGYVLGWLLLDGGRANLHGQGTLSVEVAEKTQLKSLQAWTQHGPTVGPGLFWVSWFLRAGRAL